MREEVNGNRPILFFSYTITLNYITIGGET
jgi:hypothetical protein